MRNENTPADITQPGVSEATQAKPGAVQAEALGRIAAPRGCEATTEKFHFWVGRGQLVEDNQFVHAESEIAGEKITYYGLVEKVYRESRRPSMIEEFDVFDGDLDFAPPFANEGVNYASVNLLRIEPEILTPPRESSLVRLGGAEEAGKAYGFADMNRPLPVGLLKNGTKDAGLGFIDLDYLLGENGGHLNVNGMAGVGTKTSFLLTVIKLLQQEAEKSRATRKPLFIVPIILNVKGEDLLWLDKANRRFQPNDEAAWRELGLEPKPFAKAQFYTPQGLPVHGCNSESYSWSFHDVLREGSLLYIFADEDDLSGSMNALARELVADFTERKDGRTPRSNAPATWDDLLAWMGTTGTPNNRYSAGTWWAVYRRLFKVLDEGRDIFARDKQNGKPLRVTRATTAPPQIVDINALPYSLQRFVVGSIINQVVAARKARNAVRDLRYVIMLDELNRFAPKSAKDEITRLLERVASEMRSQGVILLGAQQMASQVSTKVIEMSSIRVLGRTGAAELTDKVWSSWGREMRAKAAQLQAAEKLISQPTFRQPMLVKLPLNPWADKRDNIAAGVSGRPLEI